MKLVQARYWCALTLDIKLVYCHCQPRVLLSNQLRLSTWGLTLNFDAVVVQPAPSFLHCTLTPLTPFSHIIEAVIVRLRLTPYGFSRAVPLGRNSRTAACL
jgi:hypothetical protein